MICRYYEFNLENNLPNNTLPAEANDCVACDKTKCKYCHDINHPLTKHKFSWTLSRLFQFPEGTFEKGELKNSKIGIRLIHPQDESIWVLKCYSEEKGTFYNVMRKRNIARCKDMNEVNTTLKSDRYSYGGRDISEHDFELKG